MKFDRKRFFDAYRAAFGAIQQLQVDGLEFLLGAIESDPKWESLPQIAYLLATIKHETGISRGGVNRAFQPIKELRARPGTKLRATQDRYWGSDYFGRGYLQLTWKANYQKFGLADDPEKALEPSIAYRIAADGMREGLFTGKKLSDYINGEVDYVHARKIVNGMDRATDIAEIARKFERILRTSLVKEDAEPAAAELAKDIEAADEQPRLESKPPTQPPDFGGAAKADPPVQTLPARPPIVEVKNQGASLTTKIAASASAVMPILTATGLKVGGIELSTGALYALAAIIIVGTVVGGLIYNEGQKRAWERQKLSMENLANPAKGNVVAGSES